MSTAACRILLLKGGLRSRTVIWRFFYFLTCRVRIGGRASAVYDGVRPSRIGRLYTVPPVVPTKVFCTTGYLRQTTIRWIFES